MTKFEEYRKPIIYSAVTGKIDCRTETEGMRYSDRHLAIYEICERLAENSKSLFEFEKALKAKEIPCQLPAA